jgi:hypothetical protein
MDSDSHQIDSDEEKSVIHPCTGLIARVHTIRFGHVDPMTTRVNTAGWANTRQRDQGPMNSPTMIGGMEHAKP